ncbi:MAG: hypothetical protein GY811_17255 [Myxococcales bacterium]|nr:hypothetical protein [Myxococcales bacterium]
MSSFVRNNAAPSDAASAGEGLRGAKDPNARHRRTASRAASLAGNLQGRRRRPTSKVESGEFSLARTDGAVADAEILLASRIRAHMATGQLDVTLTDNRYTMISVRRDTECAGARVCPQYRVRLHHMFADAAPLVTQALAHYIGKDDKDASKVLGDFIDANQHRVRAESARKTSKPITQGACHDLQGIYDGLNERYFDGTIEATITWGQRCGKVQKRNSIKMGSYSIEDKSIRIHRSLDRAYVPSFFVEWIVYHEMLHQVHDAPIVNGRRQFHSKAFLEDEAAFEHYALARLWERDHLEQLLTY